MPYELWDKPSAEITNMKTQCETLLENFEDDISNWYFHHQEIPLQNFLCRDRVLKGDDDKCLDEKLEIDDGDKKKGETKDEL